MRTILFLSLAASLFADEFPKPFNTGTDVGKKPMSADEAVKLIKMPEGFKATVFAAEPDVQNPIACAWDSRGRLWIAENYTYAESAVGFDKRLRDRILIFEDTDNDGKADKRTVFADNLHNLSSIELGYGGVYATAAPYLLWIPDADGDDKPDAPKDERDSKDKKDASLSSYKSFPSLGGTSTKILLDGFDAGGVRHNFVNGLRWGPDGWLYGRHGILATSKVGTPGTPDAERLPINVGIWRWHPVRHTVEMVTYGGTNPWGLDFNAEGEGFFTNTVTGHLYHMIPGAHYERMYGEDPNPYIYQLLPQTADHYHYDRSKSWTASRDGAANDHGGGHAHVGCMIYQGENWPEQYRGKLFTINLHGRCINVERLERKGSGYTAKHEPSIITFGDPWFRGNELTYGPDGGVYVLDWSDQGECHENDGVHRESGRIYRITFGEVKRPEWLGADRVGVPPAAPGIQPGASNVEQPSPRETPATVLAKLPTVELWAHAWIRNDWKGRICAGLLADRLAAEPLSKDARKELLSAIMPTVKRLAPDWPTRQASPLKGLRHVKLLQMVDTESTRVPFSSEIKGVIQEMIAKDTLGAGANGRRAQSCETKGKPADETLAAMESILTFPEDNDDFLLPILYWSTFERLFSDKSEAIVEGARTAAFNGKIPLIIENTARRLASDFATKPERIDGLLALAAATFDETKAASILRGISAALRGTAKAKAPASWPAFAAQAAKIPALADKLRSLNVIFGDGRALDEIRALALDSKAEIPARRQAVESLIAAKPADLRATLEKLIATDRDLMGAALRGMAVFDDAGPFIATNYQNLRPDLRAAVVPAMCSRPAFAAALLDAVANGKIARSDITPYHARQIAALADEAVNKRLAEVWGSVATTSDQKKTRMAELRAALTPEVVAKADIEKGRAIYTQACAACHTLYDLGQTGANLGPNLTGSGRGDINYLLENIVDPSALVPADYKLSTVTMKDGRVLSGFISTQNAQTMTLRTMTETQTLDRTTVAKTEASAQSLMPEGILDALKPEQIRDLFGFLMKK